MTTIKSYIDISQSKTLSKILPIESADYFHVPDINIVVTEPYITDCYGERCIPACPDAVPCWSLSTLLGVLPKNLNIGRPSLESNYKGYYSIQYYDEFMKPNSYKTECFNNPVNACVAMIEKLHKLNLL